MLNIAFIAPVLPARIRQIEAFRSSSVGPFRPLKPRRSTRPNLALCVANNSVPDSIQDSATATSDSIPPLQNGSQSKQPNLSPLSASDISLATSPPPSFRLQAADVFMLCIFCAGCLYPAIRSQEASVRTRALLSGGIIFTVHSILYLLRMRSLQKLHRAQITASQKLEAYLSGVNDDNSGEELRAALAAERPYLDDAFGDVRGTIRQVAGRSERRADRLHAEVLRSMRGDVDELRAGLDLVRDNLSRLNSDEVAHLRSMLMAREHTAVQLETKLATIKTDLDAAGIREQALRVEIETLKAAAGDTRGLQERLLAAQTRTATLEERLLRAQDAAVSSQDNLNSNLQLQQIPGTKALREALLNLGKSFPPAGKLLFDPPAEDMRDNMERKSILSSQSQSLQQDPLNWPQAPLGPDDMGLPKDGGFGTNHFSDSNNGAESTKKNLGAAKDPFSALRGAFNEDSSGALPAVENEKDNEKKVTVELENPKLVSEDGTVENESIDSDEALAERESGVAVESKVDAEKKSGEAVPTGEPAFQKEEASASTGSYLESLRKDTAAFEQSNVAGLEVRLAKARELVKRARRGDAGEAERSFSAALALLDAAPPAIGGTRVDAEIGGILLAWARRDIAADGAKARLERAAGLLRKACEKEEGARFNLALTLCMLASLEESPSCEKLYEEACGHYDQLGTQSRTVCFNSGLAYISRARLAEAEQGDGNGNSTEMYRRAEELFNAALKFSPDDTKSKTYREECRAKLKEAAERGE